MYNQNNKTLITKLASACTTNPDTTNDVLDLVGSNLPKIVACVVKRLYRKREQKQFDSITLKNTTRPLVGRKVRVACDSSLIRVHISILNAVMTRRTLLVDPSHTIRDALLMHNACPGDRHWISHVGKPLNLSKTFADYGMCNDAHLQFNERMLGGSNYNNVLLPTYSHVRNCEIELLFSGVGLQADSSAISDAGEKNEFIDLMMNRLTALKDTLADGDQITDLLESFFQVAYWFRKCDRPSDYVLCTSLAYKLIVGKGVTTSFLRLMSPTHNLQGEFEDCVAASRRIFDLTTSSLSNPLVERMRKLYTYLLVQGFLKQVGMSMSDEEFLTLDRKARAEFTSETGLMVLIIDTSIMLCERICAYRATGDWMNLVHTDAAYAAWFKEADRLLSLGSFTSNLEALGTTYFAYCSDLNSSIEKGDAYCRFSKKTLGAEMIAMKKKLASLKLLKNLDLTKRAAQKERKAPFGVLIHGASSVAKSTFTKALFYYYGQLHGLDTDDHFMFARSPMDEYWSNFDPSMWAIRMDDVALLDPASTTDVDPTVRDIINVINNVPYVPPQAAVEDKGRTPVMAKLVLATTNTPHLNAGEFFACPLAVRRRLPYVVHIKPKTEYLATNKTFIDPTKLPPIESEFPDYWEITVQEVVPMKHRAKDDAELKTIAVFTSMAEFLKHFAEASLKHEGNQAKAAVCDDAMKTLKVCRLCYQVGACECLQAEITISGLCLYYLRYLLVDTCSHFALQMVLNMLSMTLFYYLAQLQITGWVLTRWASYMNKSMQIRVWGFLFLNGRDRVYTLRLHQFLKALKFVTTVYLSYKAAHTAWKWTFPSEEKNKRAVEKSDVPLEVQGNIFGSTEQQLEKETNSNVWYNPTVELNRFDVPLAAQSLVGITDEAIRDRLAQNCVRLSITSLDTGRNSKVCGVFVKGHWLMFNNHAVTGGTRYEIEILSMTQSQGLTSNTKVRVNSGDFRVCAERDAVFVEIRDVSPRKDITSLWCEASIPVSKMVSIRREKTGRVSCQSVYGVTFADAFPVEALKRNLALYMGKVREETQVGDCGSIAVAITPRGPVIIGLHTLGYLDTAGFTYIPKSVIDNLTQGSLVVTAGPQPKFDLQGSVQLTEPHHRSLMRYIERGTLTVFGSMPGFRAKPRSKVCATPLQKEMLSHFDVEVKHREPYMTGFAPWRNNLLEMVVPNHDIDTQILKECTQSFATDILKSLTATHGEEWKRELLFLSKKASLNGLPGVKFIDRVNVNSSMGSPFNTSKKAYLKDAPCEQYPDGIDFDEIVWEMYDEISTAYANGERVNPVFMGHLKDEPVTHAKHKAQKTRLFTGAPVAWCLVVRSRFLTMVRLIQQNPFIFEAGPGTVAQSTAWGTIRNYLVAHGSDRIVAGDYSKFDKRMIARFVLSAFDVLIALYREAGFSEAELLELQCIAEDTAFPLVNVNGDVVEFFGTNPSGHPLTVIINSIVNSIYMRYAYVLANPQGECSTFKENVNLFTYGDDNIMGVSPKCEWFNHTAIQGKLATIGVQYTMADKEAETKPFIHIDDCSFLKRSWRHDLDVGAFVCPLEEESIHKSLTVWVPSATLCPEAQMVDVISSANSEYFFYGREVFERHHRFFKEILAQSPYCHYVAESTLPGWDLLVKRFWKASEGNKDPTR